MKIPRIITGEKILDDFFEKWASAIEYSINTTGVSPVRVSKGASGNIISASTPGTFFATIDENLTDGRYHFYEVFENSSGAWQQKPDGLEGESTEFNLNPNVQIPSVVIMYRFQAEGSFRFQRGSCA